MNEYEMQVMALIVFGTGLTCLFAIGEFILGCVWAYRDRRAKNYLRDVQSRVIE